MQNKKCRVCGWREMTDIDWMVRARSAEGEARAAVAAVQQGGAAHSRRKGWRGGTRKREREALSQSRLEPVR